MLSISLRWECRVFLPTRIPYYLICCDDNFLFLRICPPLTFLPVTIAGLHILRQFPNMRFLAWIF